MGVPWKVTSPVKERMAFVARLHAGERMADLCREFGISRKTGYKFVARFERLSVVGLEDQSRAPVVRAKTPSEIEDLVVALRRKHPTWGPRKLLATLKKQHDGVKLPGHSTVARILSRHGLAVPRRPRRHRPSITHSPLCHAKEPNDVWCIDYKGQFRLGDGTLCYPLTLTDAHSRFILACEAFTNIDGDDVKRVLTACFVTFGVPKAMRFDGGAPFASSALRGWSKLSVWLLRLGIALEQIEPASPQQNGRHERMHRTLKAETTRPAAKNVLQQQERFDVFVAIFNNQRPHEALGQETPASVYAPSPRAFPAMLPELSYPMHELTARVDSCGHVRLPGAGRKMPSFFISGALRHQRLGLRELDDTRWLVSFMTFDLGELNLKTRRFESYKAAVTEDVLEQGDVVPATRAEPSESAA